MDEQDFEIWRGNAYRVVGWNFPFDLAQSEIVLTVKWRGGEITRTTADGGLLVEQTTVNGAAVPVVWWDCTEQESRQIPLADERGPRARYELERRVNNGEKRTYVHGAVIAKGGDNGD